MLLVLSLVPILKQQFDCQSCEMTADTKSIDIKNQTYYFFNDMINLKDFHSKLLKTGKSHTKTLIFTILDRLQSKNLMIMKIFTV